MAKEAYYFSHDSNARHDEKIIMLLFKHDWYGYGLYWALIEKLRDATDYKLKLDYKLISFDLKTDEAKVESIINDFELFTCEDGHFWSESLMDRMKKKEEKSIKTRQSALIKWENRKTGTQKRSERLTEARKKGKHTKQEWEEMKEFFNNTCVRCNGESGLVGVVRDHITPIYQGGSDGICNIQPLCARCNAQKGSENIDHRRMFCKNNACEMPAKFSEMPAIKESKVKEKKEKKNKYGEYNNVLLSKSQYDKLKLKCETLPDLLEFFSKKKKMKGYTYKEDYLAILEWGIKAYNKLKDSSEDKYKRFMENDNE